MTRGQDVENNTDDKKSKRLVANRRSALKSRQKKAALIQALESEVNEATLSVQASTNEASEVLLKNQLLQNKAEELKSKVVDMYESLKRMGMKNELYSRELQRLQAPDREMATSRSTSVGLLGTSISQLGTLGGSSGHLMNIGGTSLIPLATSYGSWGQQGKGPPSPLAP